MSGNELYIKMEHIPGGIRMNENFSKRFVECLQQDYIHESMYVLRGLINVVGELNRNCIWNMLYPIFGCSVKTLKQYMFSLAESSDGNHLFERGDGGYFDFFPLEQSFPYQHPFCFSVSMEPVSSTDLTVTIRDGFFKYTDPENESGSVPATITAMAFAETLYRELYFPALRLLAGDGNLEAIKSYIGKALNEQFTPLV